MRFRAAQNLRPHHETDPAPNWRRGLKKAVAGLASTAVVAASFVAASVVTAAPAAAAEPFSCTPGSVYVQSSTEVREFAVTESGGTLARSGLGSDHQNNGLGISAGGQYSYTITNTSTAKYVSKHDRTTNTTVTSARIPSSAGLDSAILRGAVHPSSGVYYFASGTSGGGIKLYAWDEANGSPLQVGALRTAAGSTAFGANGDMAFSASGQLLIVADHIIYSADLPTVGELVHSTSTIEAKEVFKMDASVKGNGIAFGNLGRIFVSAGSPNRIIEVDLPRGEVVNTTSLGTFAPTDMASCTFPNTLTLKKSLPDGRHADTDQFALRIDGPSDYQISTVSATTTGTAKGLQSDYAGPIFVNQGDTFTLTETAAGTADLSKYASSLVCEQATAGGPVSVPVDGDTVVQPSGPLGTDVTCTFSNDRLDPSLALRKSADPASGTAVTPGQTITYTVEAENTGNTVLDPVVITDDLTGVLANAEYQDDVQASIDGAAVAGADVDGTTLSWTGALQPGQTVTVTYSVIVDDNVEGKTIENRVTASGTPPGDLPPVDPPTVVTEHPVAGFEITKTADPASGSVVQPGQTITYTITGTNTGATTLNPAEIADDLSGVFEHAAYNDDVTTAINGTEITDGAARVSGENLTFSGSLAAGDVVTITYSVTVDADASGAVVQNTASGSATPTTPNPDDPNGPETPGDIIEPPTVSTEHPVLGSGFTISKTADPASGTAVSAGDTITYTVTGTNTGDTALKPATIVDDLSAVLEFAELTGDVKASTGDVSIADGELTWNGALAAGASVTITYSVTVKDGVDSALLRNVASGSATPQIPADPTDPDSPTTPGTDITTPEVSTEHPVVANGFEVEKTADPASGTAVSAGDTITYTVTGTNTGTTVLDPASIVDDLSAVLENAAYNGDVTASTGDVAVDGSQLTWTGSLASGASVTITYSVTVNDDASGVLLRNVASGEATPQIPADPTDPDSPTTPDTEITTPEVETEHPVVNPGFTVDKTANPATGTRVDPGTVIEYTVTGTNIGDTVLDPVTIVDNMSDALTHAAYNDDASASTGDVTVDGAQLTWKGELAPGAAVTITYSVTVNGDAGGETVRNSVRGTATPQLPEDPSDPDSPTTPDTPLEPPVVVTEHPVNTPGFDFSKTVDPESGTAIDPGQVLTYTLTGVNTGETVLHDVKIVDDLSGVFEHAAYNDDARAMVGGDAAASAPIIAADTLNWSGSLQVGESVTITYSVTVQGDAAGEIVRNVATATATPPGDDEITTPPNETENPINVPGFSVSKSADPATGTRVDPGSVITYTVTGVNTGETVLDPVVITDDLSGVLDAATYNGDAAASVGSDAVEAPLVADGELTWTGALEVGETVTITYSVTVSGDAGGETLVNSVSGTATPPGDDEITTPPTSTEHPVAEPGFEVTKSADPASGTRVDPGSVITYTVTGVNTGETVLDPVVITDDLSGVLKHAVYNDDAAAVVGSETLAAPAYADGELTWTGALAVGERVTITYSVTVNGDAGGEILTNVVNATATPPGDDEITPPTTETEHPVAEPGYTFEKTSDPASGTKIAPGTTVTYTLTGVNTGETGLDEVVITDDLSQVLPHASIEGEVTAVVGERTVAAPVIADETLTWIGALPHGESVTITYTVRVKESAAGATLKNVAATSAIAPGGDEIIPPTSGTEHPVLPPLAITGGELLPWGIGLSALLLLIGGGLMLMRRRTA